MKRKRGSAPRGKRNDGRTGSRRLDAAVRDRSSLSWTRARERIRRGKIWIDGTQILDIGHLLDERVDFEFVADTRVIRSENTLLHL